MYILTVLFHLNFNFHNERIAKLIPTFNNLSPAYYQTYYFEPEQKLLVQEHQQQDLPFLI